MLMRIYKFTIVLPESWASLYEEEIRRVLKVHHSPYETFSYEDELTNGNVIEIAVLTIPHTYASIKQSITNNLGLKIEEDAQ